MQRRPLADDFGQRARILDLLAGGAGELIGGDVAYAVAAGLDAMHLHIRPPAPGRRGIRSEERRVGKEGRSRGAAGHLKKKKKKETVAPVRFTTSGFDPSARGSTITTHTDGSVAS